MEKIPHVINYVWFGGGKHSKLQKRCMKSWRKFCPDWEIKKWDESNFDLKSAPLYVQQAYEAKRWAFVSDYARLKVLYDNGGFYFDTDTQVIKDISHLAENNAFMAFEGSEMVTSGVMGCCKGDKIVKEILENYEKKKFYNEDGTVNTTVTGNYNTEVFLRHGLKLGGEEQMVENWKIYPFTYFYPEKVINDKKYYTENTCIVHWFEGTWFSKEDIKDRKHNMNKFIKFMRKTPFIKLYYKIKRRNK